MDQDITLIGMSNIGKSATSQRIESELGYERIDCDPMVNEAIIRAVAQSDPTLKLDSIEACAKWMGQPGADNPAYNERAALFVRCEREVMQRVLKKVQAPHERPLIIDTCGSVIYTGADVVDALKRSTQIVYLAATPAYQQALFQTYIAEPKPVVWPEGIFQQAEGQSNLDALAKGYPQLLSSRDALYRSMAEKIIPFETHRDRRTNLRSLLAPRL